MADIIKIIPTQSELAARNYPKPQRRLSPREELLHAHIRLPFANFVRKFQQEVSDGRGKFVVLMRQLSILSTVPITLKQAFFMKYRGCLADFGGS
jgi:hypothetical protein